MSIDKLSPGQLANIQEIVKNIVNNFTILKGDVDGNTGILYARVVDIVTPIYDATRGKFSAFVWRISYRQASRLAKEEKGRIRPSSHDSIEELKKDSAIDDQDNPYEYMVKKESKEEQKQMLEQALNLLKEKHLKQYLVIEAHYFGGFKLKEIAIESGLTESYVRKLHERGKKNLKKILVKNFRFIL